MFKRLLLNADFTSAVTNVIATLLTVGATALTGMIFTNSTKIIKKIEENENKEKLLKERYDEALKKIEELEMIIHSKDARQ